jgi:hypothetical protein
MGYAAAVLLTAFDSELSWLPDPGLFMNMVVTMFWWILATVIASIPIAIAGFILFGILVALTGG